MYFHVVYGGGRRRYGSAGRNSPHFDTWHSSLVGPIELVSEKGDETITKGLLLPAPPYLLLSPP